MSEAVPHRLTLEEFDRWQTLQEVRCELIDGRPMAMTGASFAGASFAHDIVVSNLIYLLTDRLRARRSECRVFTANIGLVTGPDTLRRPDVSVYCPPFDTQATRSDRPVLVVEVASPSTRQIDRAMRLDEYRALPASKPSFSSSRSGSMSAYGNGAPKGGGPAWASRTILQRSWTSPDWD